MISKTIGYNGVLTIFSNTPMSRNQMFNWDDLSPTSGRFFCEFSQPGNQHPLHRAAHAVTLRLGSDRISPIFPTKSASLPMCEIAPQRCLVYPNNSIWWERLFPDQTNPWTSEMPLDLQNYASLYNPLSDPLSTPTVSSRVEPPPIPVHPPAIFAETWEVISWWFVSSARGSSSSSIWANCKCPNLAQAPLQPRRRSENHSLGLSEKRRTSNSSGCSSFPHEKKIGA